MNVVVLIGNIATELRLSTTPNGKSVLSFQVAVRRAYGQETDYIDCVRWERTAEFIDRNFGKGKRIGLQGELVTRQYVDKVTKQNRKAYEVKVTSADFAGGESTPGKSEAKSRTEFRAVSDPSLFTPVDVNSGDLPF